MKTNTLLFGAMAIIIVCFGVYIKRKNGASEEELRKAKAEYEDHERHYDSLLGVYKQANDSLKKKETK